MIEKNSKAFIILSLGLLLLGRWVIAEENRQNATWVSLGPEGGPIGALVQDPSNSNVLYAAPDGQPGRIHKSTDKGNTWSEISQISSYIYDLAIDPKNASTMYAFATSRMHKSTNGGVDWNDNYFSGHYFHGGMVDPNDSNLLHAYGRHWDGPNTRACYFKSTDGGGSWSKHYPLIIDETTYPYSATADPSNSDIVYIGGYQYSTTDATNIGYICRSTDGGASWNNITTGTNGWIYDIIVHPTSGKVYAVSTSGVYRSTNHGDTWQKNNGWAGGYLLALDPTNPDVVYAGDYNRCFKSTDGGVNWYTYTNGLYGGICYGLVVDGGTSNTVYFATDAGFFKSTNGGVDWEPSNSGLVLTQITNVKHDHSSPNTLYAGSRYNGLFRTTNAMSKALASTSVVWESLPTFTGETISAMEYVPGNPGGLYVAMEYG